MQAYPSSGYSFIIRLRYQNLVGMLGSITSCLGSSGVDISSIDIVESGGGFITRDITANVRDTAHGHACVEALRVLPHIRIINVSDRVFLLHLGGKLEITPRTPMNTQEDLMMAYTPGVSRVSKAILADPDKVFTLTVKRNMVAVVTDGSHVPGMGNIGARAAIPRMEGRAVFFKKFAGVDAFPLCLDSGGNIETILTTLRSIAPVFGAIDLEEIDQPQCFEIERQLQKELDIPVFQGDRHGSAVIVLAAIINATRLVGKNLGDLKVVLSGTGATATACARLLLSAGICHLVVGDEHGIIDKTEAASHSDRLWLRDNTNLDRLAGSLAVALNDADVFVGISGGPTATPDDVRTMGRDPIVLGLETYLHIQPEEFAGIARVIATGRSDYPNQLTTVLCFPGFFRGLLDARAPLITETMKRAAAYSIADIVQAHELHEEYILPSVFDKRVATALARVVAHEAEHSGLAQRALTSPTG